LQELEFVLNKILPSFFEKVEDKNGVEDDDDQKEVEQG
jgi:hypothetical protein